MSGKKYRRTKVFISYSRKDSSWLSRLHEHLSPLVRGNVIEIWDDTYIRGGAIWREEIEKAIGSAKVAVLLISKSFLASDFINSVELPPLLTAAEKEGAIILPLIIGACMFSETKELSRFQSVNPPSKPLEGMSKVRQDELFVKLCKEIKSLIENSSPARRQRHEIAPRQLGLDGFAYPKPRWMSRDEEETLKELAKAAFVLTAFERTKTGCWGKTYLHRLKTKGEKLPLSGGALTGAPFALVALHSYAGKKSASLLKEWSRHALLETLDTISIPGGGFSRSLNKSRGLGDEPDPECERHEAGGYLITLLLGDYGPRADATLKKICRNPRSDLTPYDKASISRALLQASYDDSIREILRSKAADRQLKLLESLRKFGKHAKPSYLWSTKPNQSDATYQWGAAWYVLPSIVAPQVPLELRQEMESLLHGFLRAQSAAKSTGGNLLPESVDAAGRGWGNQVFGSAVALVCWRTLECYGLSTTDRSRIVEAGMYARKMVGRLINSSPDILELPCTEADQKFLEGYLGWAGICLAAATLGIRLHWDDCRKGLALVKELNDSTKASLSQEELIDKYQELIQRKELFASATTLLIARCAARISLLYRFVQGEWQEF